MSYVFLDFEYNDRQVILCIAQATGNDPQAFDLRNNQDLEELREYVSFYKDHTFVSYQMGAEVGSFLRLGITVKDTKWIDLMAECRMISMSNHKYFTMDGSMLSQIQKFLGVDMTEASKHKDAMRDLIILQDSWSEEEWTKIVLYCLDDIQYMRDLLLKVIEIHAETEHPFTLEQAQKRGYYMRISTEMDYAGGGFPVWGDDVEKIYANKSLLKENIIFELPEEWRQCFAKNKVTGEYGKKLNKIAELIAEKGWTNWSTTSTGKPSLEADYLKELRLSIPEVEPFYQAVKAISTLNSADLREQVKDGYIQTQTFGFSARTGRNGLKPKRGYLLNLPKWMRRIIHPHPGMVMIGFDWSQQEIAVAAALSGDQKLLEAYESGDVYLALAKMAGAVPEDATKKSHALERELFKALQLGLGYGKGVKSLGNDFYAIMKKQNLDLARARSKALEIFNWHKRYFATYWSWIDRVKRGARRNGWIQTSDNWVEWVDSRTKDTQLLNFPSQSTGAVMMRNAAVIFYDLWQAGVLPAVMCCQHDAFYFNMKEEDVEKYKPLILEVMKQSSIDTIGVEVRCGYKVYDHTKGYEPEGMQAEHEKLWKLAKELQSE